MIISDQNSFFEIFGELALLLHLRFEDLNRRFLEFFFLFRFMYLKYLFRNMFSISYNRGLVSALVEKLGCKMSIPETASCSLDHMEVVRPFIFSSQVRPV